jgi:fructose 1,6-bisphosphate aldolase/phosphatase
MKTTISIVGAGVGSFPGPSRVHPRLLEEAAKRLKEQEGGLLIDSFVPRCGDGLELVMTHAQGTGDDEIRRMADEVLLSCDGIAKGMRLHGVDREFSPDAIEGAAEMEFEERESEPVLLFMAAGAQGGTWNLQLYRTFADPFTTPGLVSDPSMHDGFVFEVHDLAARRRAFFRTPEESYNLLACIGAPSRYLIRNVFSKEGAVAASTSSRLPSDVAGPRVGPGPPVMIVRSESGFPAVGEILAPFTTPSLVAGGVRGAYYSPLVPVAVCDAGGTVSDGPPRATCLGFQVCNGRLIGPADMFDDPAFDPVRRRCFELAETLRDLGPFEPHRLTPPETEPVDPPVTGRRPKDRWEPLS